MIQLSKFYVVIRGCLVWLKWQIHDWCAHNQAPSWSNTLIWSNPVFGFGVLFKARVTGCHSRWAPGDVWSHKRTDRATTDSGITMATTTWHSFLFFSCSVHVLRRTFCAPCCFLIKKQKRTHPIGLRSRHITVMHNPRGFFALHTVIWSQKQKSMPHIGSWNCHITVTQVLRCSFCIPHWFLVTHLLMRTNLCPFCARRRVGHVKFWWCGCVFNIVSLTLSSY
jgi:hypothetical protein